MSYKYIVINDKPTHYYPLDETVGTTVNDLIAGSNGTYSVLPTIYNPIVNNCLNSKLFNDNTATLTALNTIWNKNYPNKPFSIEFWIAPKFIGVENSILSFGSDGIYINSIGIVLRMTGVNGIHYFVAPIPDYYNKNLHVVCVFDGTNVNIYINSILTASGEFNDTISQDPGTLSINNTSINGQSYLLSNVAIYNKVLTELNVINHYNAGAYNTFYSNFTRDVNAYYQLDDDATDIVLNVLDDDMSSLLTAMTVTNLFYNGTGISPVDTTQQATRLNFYPISVFGTVDGSRIDWDSNSSNFSVDISLDFGDTWILDISNHSEIPGISRDTDLTGLGLLVRQNFASLVSDIYGSGIYGSRIYPGSEGVVYGLGIYGDGVYSGDVELIYGDNVYGEFIYSEEFFEGFADIPYLNRMHIVIYGNKNPESTDGGMRATLNGSSTLMESLNSPLQNNAMGMILPTNSYLTIPASADQTIYAIEMLVSITDMNSTHMILDSRTVSATSNVHFATNTAPTNPAVVGGIMYVNGVARAPLVADFPLGGLVHIVIVPATPITTPIIINRDYLGSESGTNTYQWIGLYYNAVPTARRIIQHYQAAFGNPVLTVNEPTTQGLTEDSWTAYNYNWGVSVG